ncbi:TonB-dependent hemoglobin/transferrin/lactoferrin family receptor [Ferrimonas aestuarii]|uniref:TonB-dependent hemoglobin/transferrin/lactoferrin family receptor n=1 Tax=Ferrimonas aestuarii TaxID=2569539 RepID=A0A4U1BMY3_9GAMM|nr:TonB-dependent hemoglobin/transferrin/lactoferrin family receptor [Ferrimonas aestuarii]TKB53073.1 TonB-dependent hemoglobin/transferrin/lactoferrin family receptor [Ferrimonas aestuarii]
MMKPAPIAAAVLAVLASQAVAEQQPKTTVFDDVVVSASRTSTQKAEDVAAAMTVVNAEQIDDELITDISQLVRYEPGVEASGRGRFGLQDFNIRGISGNRVKIMVDGVDQINAYDSGTEFMRSSRNFVDLDTLKQVEITKTPASSLYGSDSIGGVVAYTTKDPADYLEAGDNSAGSVKVGYDGADNTFSETLVFANRTGSWESLLQYTRRDGDETETSGDVGGIGDNRTEADPMDNTSNALLGKLIFDNDGAHRVGMIAEYFDSTTEGDLLSQNDGEPGGDGVTYANQKADDESSRYRISLFHDWEANLAMFDSLSWKVNYQDSESDQVTKNWYKSVNTDRIMSRNYQEQSLQLSVDFAKQLKSSSVTHDVSYGADYRDDDLENLNTTSYANDLPTSVTRYAPKASSSTYGFYLQDQITLGKLTVTPGVRYDNTEMKPEIDEYYHGGFDEFKNHSSDALTWRLGTVYKFNDNVSTFFQFAQGFRSPDLKEMYYAEDSGRGYALLANPDLEAEESDSYELGLRLNNNWGSAELVAFYNQYDNFIVSTTDYSNPSYPYGQIQYNNIDEATIKGVEFKTQLWLDALLGAPEGLTLDFSVAYADGENDTNNTPINSIAPLNGVVGLSYDDADGVWGSSLNITMYQGKDEGDIEPITDWMGQAQDPYVPGGYAIVDLIGYYNITDALVVRGGVFNLLDKKYTRWNDVAGLEDGRSYMDRYTQPGRNIGVSVSYHF